MRGLVNVKSSPPPLFWRLLCGCILFDVFIWCFGCCWCGFDKTWAMCAVAEKFMMKANEELIVLTSQLAVYCHRLHSKYLGIVLGWIFLEHCQTEWNSRANLVFTEKLPKEQVVSLFVALFVLSLCPIDISDSERAFIIGLSQILFFFSSYRALSRVTLRDRILLVCFIVVSKTKGPGKFSNCTNRFSKFTPGSSILHNTIRNKQYQNCPVLAMKYFF